MGGGGEGRGQELEGAVRRRYFVAAFQKFSLGKCPPTPPLSQYFALSDKYVSMLA